MSEKPEMSAVKMNNKELKEKRPFAFIHISLKLFFIHSFNKLAQSVNKKKLSRKVKKANKKQIKEL